MILPSDSDLPPERDDSTPGDPPESGTPWWDDPDLTGGHDDGDDEDGEAASGDDDISYLGDPDDGNELPPALATMAGPGWRKDLYKDLLDSLRELEAIEDPDDEFAPPEPPDLFTFFGELAALRNELRHQGQHSHDTLNQLEKTLAPLLRAKPGKTTAPSGQEPGAGTPWSVASCLALISAWDLLPEATSAAAYEATFVPLFLAAGLSRIPTVGLPFDPALMTLAGTEKGPAKSAHKVLRETSAGFLRDGTLLRPAGVITAG
jgi:hypothetical protein